MFCSPSRPKRILMIIAPSLHQCWHTAKEFGFEPPHMENFRNVTKASQLRGVREGTPFIKLPDSEWGSGDASGDLARAVDLYIRTGHLRIAQERDLKACRPFDGVPKREARG